MQLVKRSFLERKHKYNTILQLRFTVCCFFLRRESCFRNTETLKLAELLHHLNLKGRHLKNNNTLTLLCNLCLFFNLSVITHSLYLLGRFHVVSSQWFNPELLLIFFLTTATRGGQKGSFCGLKSINYQLSSANLRSSLTSSWESCTVHFDIERLLENISLPFVLLV